MLKKQELEGNEGGKKKSRNQEVEMMSSFQSQEEQTQEKREKG